MYEGLVVWELNTHKVVVKKNTATEDSTIIEEKYKEYKKLSKQNQWPPAQTCTTADK